jgi:flagellar biosynthesis protein FliR
MVNELQTLLTTNLFAWLLIFTRVGTAMMSLPGFGEAFVSTRIRLLLSLAVSLVLVPVIGPKLPAMPAQTFMLFALIGAEAFYGAFIGLLARLIVATVETAGMIIAMQISLSNASVFNPAMAAQSSLTSALLGMCALVLLFATDLHHLMLLAVADSYSVFIPGEMPNFGDFASAYGQLLSQSFLVATQLSAPFIILGLVFYLGLGLLARLMPQLQIFFIAIPAQIYLGLLVLGLTLSAVMMMWLQYAQSTLQGFLDVR